MTSVGRQPPTRKKNLFWYFKVVFDDWGISTGHSELKENPFQKLVSCFSFSLHIMIEHLPDEHNHDDLGDYPDICCIAYVWLTLCIRVAPVSKTISTKGGWADDDEGDEPEEKAEDSRPLRSEEVGGFCEVGLQLRYCRWSMIGEDRDIYIWIRRKHQQKEEQRERHW